MPGTSNNLLKGLISTCWIEQGEAGFYVVLAPTGALLNDLAEFDREHGEGQIQRMRKMAAALNQAYPTK